MLALWRNSHEPQLEDRPLTDTPYTYTEEWRMRCELRMVWRMSQERRQGYYALVAKHRGQASADRIRRAIEDEEAKRR